MIPKQGGFALLTSAVLLGCTFSAPPQKDFFLYSESKSLKEVFAILSSLASANGYSFHHQSFFGPSNTTTSHTFMLNGKGVQVNVQSALMEQCEDKEGRRDIEFSSRVFDVSVFSTSWLPNDGLVGTEAQKLKNAFDRNGLRVVTSPELCGLL